MRVESDPGRPLRGATLLYNGQKVGLTGDDGSGKLKLNGKDGDSFDIVVSCPEGYQSPPKPVQVILHRLAESSKKPEYLVTCPPTTRTVVVAIRADNGPNLPVMYLGREMTRTDAAGAAHVMFRLRPDDQFSLQLSTSEKGAERLLPKNPEQSFTVKDHDEVVTYDMKFDQEKAKAVVWHGPAAPRGPQRIGGKH